MEVVAAAAGLFLWPAHGPSEKGILENEQSSSKTHKAALPPHVSCIMPDLTPVLAGGKVREAS